MDKRWMYEESMQMPFIMHLPKGMDHASVNELLINNTDFAPTLLELAGGKTPDYMQGKSFAQHLDGSEPDDWRQATYYRYWMHLTHHDVPAHFGIRTKKHKLMFYYSQPFKEEEIGKGSMWWMGEGNSYPIRPTPVAWEFYDLEADPTESHNQYDNPKYREIIAELKKDLKAEREALNETDANFPRFAKVIEANWER